MGLDGGTKITRSDVLRRQSSRWAQQDTSRSTRGGSVSQVYQEKQIDEQIRRTIIWTTCALSGLPLVAPIVADALGQLFNKQAVLEHLLAAKAVAAAANTTPAPAAGASAQPLALPAGAQAPAAAGTTLVAAPARITAGSIVSYSAPVAAAGTKGAAAPPKELAAACLRYENQQRAAAAAAAASGDASAAAQGTFDHIKSLKDVFLVQLTSNPDAGHPSTAVAAATAAGPSASAAAAAQGAHAGLRNAGMNGISNSNNHSEDLPSPWMCPVTLQPCGSKQPFSALKPCGHVLSQKALTAIMPAGKRTGSKAAEVASLRQDSAALYEDGQDGFIDGMTCCCPVCEVPFDPEKDAVLISGSQQHMDAVRERVLAAAALRAQAKQKKRKRVAAVAIQ